MDFDLGIAVKIFISSKHLNSIIIAHLAYHAKLNVLYCSTLLKYFNHAY